MQLTGLELNSLISSIPLIISGVIILSLACLIKKEIQLRFFNQTDENSNLELKEILLIFFVSMFLGCSKEDGGTDTGSDNTLISAHIGSNGGEIVVSDDNVFVALGTVNSVLSRDRRDDNKFPDNYLNKLVEKYRGDGGDESGARYHFFGTALYAFALEHVKAQSTILTLDDYFNNDILGNLISSETLSTIEEGIVSGDLISDPTEYAVDLKGAELGRQLYQEVMGSTRDELLEKYNIDKNNCYDFTYSYDKPGTTESMKHVASVTNMDVREEGDFTYWQMDKGGVKDGQNLGTIIFQFDFNHVIAEANLVAYIHTFTWLW